jgi:hypothetical protein
MPHHLLVEAHPPAILRSCEHRIEALLVQVVVEHLVPGGGQGFAGPIGNRVVEAARLRVAEDQQDAHRASLPQAIGPALPLTSLPAAAPPPPCRI